MQLSLLSPRTICSFLITLFFDVTKSGLPKKMHEEHLAFIRCLIIAHAKTSHCLWAISKGDMVLSRYFLTTFLLRKRICLIETNYELKKKITILRHKLEFILIILFHSVIFNLNNVATPAKREIIRLLANLLSVCLNEQLGRKRGEYARPS